MRVTLKFRDIGKSNPMRKKQHEKEYNKSIFKLMGILKITFYLANYHRIKAKLGVFLPFLSFGFYFYFLYIFFKEGFPIFSGPN